MHTQKNACIVYITHMIRSHTLNAQFVVVDNLTFGKEEFANVIGWTVLLHTQILSQRVQGMFRELTIII